MPDVCLPCQANRWRLGELACDTLVVFLAFSPIDSRHESDVLHEEQLSAALHSFWGEVDRPKVTRFNPRIVLYGPPAVGKSTLIRRVHAIDDERVRFAVAIDLECVSSECRESAIRDLATWTTDGPLIVGPADMHPPKHFAWDAWRIVGLVPRDDDWYRHRFEERNRKAPEKANQNAMKHCRDIREQLDANRSSVATVIDPKDFDGDATGLLTSILDLV